MTKSAIAFAVLVAIGVLFLVGLAFAPLTGMAVPTFNPALESWTKWVASIVGIIVSARVLWTTAVWIEKKLI